MHGMSPVPGVCSAVKRSGPTKTLAFSVIKNRKVKIQDKNVLAFLKCSTISISVSKFVTPHQNYLHRINITFTASTLLSPHQHYLHRVNITFTASTFLSPRQHYFNHVNITFTRQHLCHCLNISKASTYISPRQHFVHRVNISIPASKLFHRVNICFTTSHFFHPYLSSRHFFHRVI